MELNTSAIDSTASATNACEWPKIPASIFAAARTAFVAKPRNVVRRLRLSRDVAIRHLCQKPGVDERANHEFTMKNTVASAKKMRNSRHERLIYAQTLLRIAGGPAAGHFCHRAIC